MEENVLITCQKCGTVFPIGPVTTVINYPKDTSSLFGLIEGKLNVNECPACHTAVFIESDLAIIDGSEKRCIAYSRSDKGRATLEGALPSPYEIVWAADVSDLRRLLLQWMTTKIAAVVHQMEASHRTSLTPIQQRLLLSATQGYIKMTHADGDAFDASSIKDMYVNAVTEALWGILEESVRNAETLSVYDTIKKRIFPECLTVDVLTTLQRACKNWAGGDDRDKIIAKWFVEFLHACARLAAGSPNPRQPYFTELTYLFWTSHLKNALPVDQQYVLLNKDLGSRLLLFTTLFDQFVLGFNETHGGNFEELSGRIGKIMDHYGWGERFFSTLAERFAIQGDMDESSMEAVSDRMVTEVLDKFPSVESENFGYKVRDVLYSILPSKQIEVAKLFLDKVLQAKEGKKDFTACISICVQSIKAFNKFNLWDISEYLVDLVTGKFSAHLPSISRRLYFDFLIEAGNVARYTFKYDVAQQLYEGARQMIKEGTVHEDANERAEAQVVLKRNLAIVYRETGHIAQSEQTFQELISAFPGDFGLIFNLATLYFKVNAYAKIIDLLLPYRHSTLLDSGDSMSCLSALTIAMALTDEKEAALQTYQTAFGHYSFLLNPGKAQLLTAGLLAFNADSPASGVSIEQETITLFKNLSMEERVQAVYFTTGIFYLRRLLASNRIDEAREQSPLFGWEKDFHTRSLEFSFYLCWYAYATRDFKRSRKWAKKLVAIIDSYSLEKEDAKYALSWMLNKEELQAQMMKIIYELFVKGILSETDLLTIIEFSYGRELSIKLAEKSALPSIPDLLEHLAEAHPKSLFLVFFEADDALLFMAILPATGRIIVPDAGIISCKEASLLRSATLDAYKNACPGLLSYTEKKLIPFRAFLGKLGAILSQWVTDDLESVFIVPGKVLINLPLHLIPMGDTTLIEKLPVLYINNLSTLSLIKDKTSVRGKALITTVTKEEESEEYLRLSKNVQETVETCLTKMGYDTLSLAQRDATIEAVVRELPLVEEAIFCCHGTTGTTDDGSGICLSFQNRLPPDYLPIEKVPVLKNFLLSWRDMDLLPQSPRVVVSAACSSGHTLIGKGGTQLGLEQALFSRGTSVIISPLWDVDQESASYWIEAFYTHRAHFPASPIEAAYRAACLSTKEKYVYDFHWAPFIFKGSLN